MMRRLWSHLSFRQQLTAMIATVFLAGGAILLVTQHLVLRSLLSEAVTMQDGRRKAAVEHSGPMDPEEDPVIVESRGPAWIHDPVVDEVLAGVQLWAGALLVGLTVVMIGAAWLVSRQALRRVSAVTETTNAITEHDLSQRLDLPGPDDEIKRLGSAIDGMIERLESAFARQESFIANASHEFRTPLATTRTALQIAIRQNRVPAAVMPEIEEVLLANRRMEELVSDLLLVAQGRVHAELPREQVELAPLVAQALDEQIDAADIMGLSANATLPPDPVLVSGSAPLLQSVVSNLVANSVRHNVVNGFVDLRLVIDGDDVELTIENPGDREFDAESAARLTEPFHRGERSRIRNDDGSEAGTGLGLTLVQSIAELHGGGIRLSGRDGGGLVARLTLPRAF